ncbi:MAG: ABC transporter ATP-binding protein/permease [Alphaproteobacteria bacterium]|jgi:ABC-type multidrug transport system fused ATPase/permease subunit|nr:ABC transporter ATP-binding protein/permease [Alphaproteobacteria bacterium]
MSTLIMEKSPSALNVIAFCFSKFFAVIRDDKRLLGVFFVAVTIFVVALLFNITLPLILKFIVQSIDNKSTNPQLFLIAVCGYGFMWTVAQIGEHIREMTSVRAIERTLRKLTTSFYEAVLKQPNLHKRLPSTGSIINTLAIFREGYQNLIWGLLFFLLPTLLEILCACGILWYLYGGFYSSILFFTISLYAICTGYGVSRYLKHQTQAFELSGQVSGFLSDRLFNIETVNSLGSPTRELSLLNEKLSFLEEKTTRTKQLFETVRVMQGIIIGCALTLVTYKCVSNIIAGQQGLSDFILINSYIIQFFSPLSSLGVVMNDLYKSFAEVAGFIELVKLSEDEKIVSGTILPKSKVHSISTRDLCFSYNDKNFSFALKDINISLEAGWKIGIVGPSGSGKSTLGKLLGGLYLPEKGEIFFDGIPYSSYDRQALKASIALTPQQVQLFCDSMRGNILYANPFATPRELNEAIQAAQLKEVIDRLPNGLETFLGEQGACLSGGERQRIGIARALLKKPQLFILDEPTSFLDLQTEELILAYFRSLQGVSTQIMIAHRLRTIMDADWVLYMERGEVIAQGTPQSLLQTCSSFRALWELDTREFANESTVTPLQVKIG